MLTPAVLAVAVGLTWGTNAAAARWCCWSLVPATVLLVVELVVDLVR